MYAKRENPRCLRILDSLHLLAGIDSKNVEDDERFAHAAVWEFQGPGAAPVRHEEPLAFESVHLSTRSYK